MFSLELVSSRDLSIRSLGFLVRVNFFLQSTFLVGVVFSPGAVFMDTYSESIIAIY